MIKTNLKKILTIATFTSFLISSCASALTEAVNNTLPIGIVDFQVLLEKSTAIQKAKEQLDKKNEEFRSATSKTESSLKKKYEELEKQKSVLSKESFEQKNNDLSKEFNDAQKKAQESGASLNKASMDAMEQFRTTLIDIVKEEANKTGTKLVLQKEQVLYSESTLDITNQVLESLNKKIPTLTVKF